jgi:hypothetical protein
MVKPSLQRGIVMQRAPDHAQPVNMNHDSFGPVADNILVDYLFSLRRSGCSRQILGGSAKCSYTFP